MTLYFMGGEMASFTPSSSGAVEVSTYGVNTFGHDTNFARCSIEAHGVNYFETPVFASLTNCWTHFHIQHNSSVADLTTYPVRWKNASGTEVVRIAHHTVGVVSPGAGTDTFDFEYWNGSTWVAIGSPVSMDWTIVGGERLDARILCNTSSGKLELYNGGTRVINASVNLSSIANIAQVKFIGDQAGGFNFQINVSEVIVADATTVGYRLLTRYPSGNGTNTAWTGTYADVDEIVYSDSDEISSASANQVETYTVSGPAIPSGYFVKAVGVYARAKNDGTGPANLQLCTRVGGTNYFSSTKSLDTGFQAVGNIWENDPSTSTTWDNATIDTLEAGVKSVA